METTLNPKIWVNDDTINPEIRKNLLQIARDFIKFVKVKKLRVHDVILTGSLANYTWNDRSDIDLHIVFNLSNFERHRKFLNEYLQSKKAAWNQSHNVKMAGYKIEVYPQDMDEPHSSSGVFSLAKNVWLKKPQLDSHPPIDKVFIRKKYQDKVDQILYFEELIKKSKADYKKLIAAIEKFMDNIVNKRDVALKQEGEFASENIVFKLLKNNGFLDRLTQLKKDIYDKALTVNSKSKEL